MTLILEMILGIIALFVFSLLLVISSSGNNKEPGKSDCHNSPVKYRIMFGEEVATCSTCKKSCFDLPQDAKLKNK